MHKSELAQTCRIDILLNLYVSILDYRTSRALLVRLEGDEIFIIENQRFIEKC